MTRLRVAAATALLVPLALAGCAEDDPQPKLPSASATSPTTTASATPDAPVEPTLPPEAQGKDEAAAEAFVRYFYDLINYAQVTGDVRAIKRVSFPSCDACANGAKFVHDIYAEGGFIDGASYTVSEVLVDLVTNSRGVQTFNATVRTANDAFTQRESANDEPVAYAADTDVILMSLGRDASGFKVASWKAK